MSAELARLLDPIGRRLLRALQEDARLTYSELGARVGLSPPAVAERLRRLEESGVITGYRARIDGAKLGLPITAFIRCTSPGEALIDHFLPYGQPTTSIVLSSPVPERGMMAGRES